MYKDEYKDCRSIKARFNQYFIHGKYQDCTQWRHDWDNCHKWRDDKNVKAAVGSEIKTCDFVSNGDTFRGK